MVKRTREVELANPANYLPHEDTSGLSDLQLQASQQSLAIQEDAQTKPAEKRRRKKRKRNNTSTTHPQTCDCESCYYQNAPYAPYPETDGDIHNPSQQATLLAQDPSTSPPPPDLAVFHSASEVPPELKKYWNQRYDLFSLYDYNVWLTRRSWFEVTPECVGVWIAEVVLRGLQRERRRRRRQDGAGHDGERGQQVNGQEQQQQQEEEGGEGGEEGFIILDAFAGIGGNSLAFASHPLCSHVYSLEQDPQALTCLEHNSRVYGVRDKITLVPGDYFSLSGSFGPGKVHPSPDAVFVSPPWGGPGYKHDGEANGGVFDLEAMQPYSFSEVYRAARAYSEKMAFFLPRTSDPKVLVEVMRKDEKERGEKEKGKCRAVHTCINARSKAICAFYGGIGPEEDGDLGPAE